VRFWRRNILAPKDRSPVNFTLPDDREQAFVYDADYRRRKNAVLIWYRGHW